MTLIHDFWWASHHLQYGQLVKRKSKRVFTTTRVMWGQKETLTSQLKAARLSGRIQTAFVERFNLTLRRGVTPLKWKTLNYAHLPILTITHFMVAKLLSSRPATRELDHARGWGTQTTPHPPAWRRELTQQQEPI
jgi:hypothetical protein